MAVIFSFDSTTREVSKITGICYDIVERLPTESKEREEILRFIQLSRSEIGHFSAAGFFTLSRTTILELLSVAATYSIIIIQFQQT